MNIFKKQWVREYTVLAGVLFLVITIIFSIGVLTWWQAMIVAFFATPILMIATELAKVAFLVAGIVLYALFEFLTEWIDSGEE